MLEMFPAVAYHENGSHEIVSSAEQAKKLGAGYSDKPNDLTMRALRKASGAARTDQATGVASPAAEAY